MADKVQRNRKQFHVSTTVVYIVAWLALVIALVGFASRFMPVTNHTVLIFAALSPYLVVFAGLSTCLLLLSRQWWTASIALLLVALAVFVELPSFIGSDRVPANTIPIRVLTANLYEGSADSAALVALARDRADLLVFEELTPELADTLTEHGLATAFPYIALDARPGAAGVGIWSRYPVIRSRLITGYQLGVMSAVIRPPYAADDVVVLAAHLAGPWPQSIASWHDELAKFTETMDAAAADAGRGAAITAGDFNATTGMQPFRRLLRSSFRDAAEQSGAGLVPTYPAHREVPPFIGIDHILTHNSAATDVQTVQITGSDHLGVIATVHIPR